MNVERFASVLTMAELDTREKRLDPFPIFKQLRQTTPIRFDQTRNCWDVFRYEDVHSILKDPSVFSSKRAVAAQERESILTMDPPRHNQMRSLVNKAFTPKMINDLTPEITSITLELLEKVKNNGRMDLVKDFAVPLPVIVIAELLGVPVQDRHLFKEWSDILVKGPEANIDEAWNQMMQEKERAIKEMEVYFTDIIQLRRNEAKEDLISILLAAEIDGKKLTGFEVISFSVLLLAAGNETTTNLITNAVRRLTEDALLQKQLQEQTVLLPNFIEEVLRFYPPISAIGRIATKDVSIGGYQIKAGDQLVSWVASANRDENKFLKPEDFYIDRQPNPHLSFGFGIHFCLGAPLARLEAQIALNILLQECKGIQLEHGAELTPIPSPFVFGVKQFPVTFIH